MPEVTLAGENHGDAVLIRGDHGRASVAAPVRGTTRRGQDSRRRPVEA